MLKKNFLNILEQVAKGHLAPEEALNSLGEAPFEHLINGLNLDHHRALRTGLGEVVLAEGKSLEHLLSAVQHLASAPSALPVPQPVLVTRLNSEQAAALQEHFPNGQHCPRARLFALNASLNLSPPWPDSGDVIVISAGAADMPVALEAFGCASFFGLNVGLLTDAGVAGLHRLTPHLPTLARSKIVIAVAGMEGALPGVLAGLLPCPVLAVPTSQGYGVSAKGFAALAGMLASCVPGLAVLNIDNGFGAAAFAAKLLQQVTLSSPKQK